MKLALSAIAVIAGSLTAFAAFENEGEPTPSASGSPIEANDAAAAEAPPVVPFDLDLELATALHRLSLTPDAMAAAGLDAQGAQALIASANQAQAAVESTLAQADAAWAAANVEVESLARTVRSGLASEDEVAQLAAAKQTRSTAEVARQLELDTLFGLATAEVSIDARQVLSTIRSNADWRLPVAYLVVDREEQSWVDLRDALADRRISTEDGSEADPASLALLAEIEADATVAAALVGIETHGPSIQASWDAALAN